MLSKCSTKWKNSVFFFFLIFLSQGLTISFRWGLNSCWSPGRSPACECPASASKEARNPGLPHQAWLTVFLILWAIWFPKNKSTRGWSDWTGLTWNTEVGLWNPWESYQQRDGAVGCRAGTDGNICRGASSITMLSTRSFLCKDEAWRAQKDDYGVLYRLPSPLWAKHKKAADEAHCQPLESLSLPSQETLSWWHPKMSAPAQVFPIHAALRTTRARVCPPCSTCRSSSMAFLIPPGPLMSIVWRPVWQFLGHRGQGLMIPHVIPQSSEEPNISDIFWMPIFG